MNILFTCAGRRNYLIRYFKEIIGDSGNTIAVDSDATASALVDADIARTVPPLDHVDYLESLLTIIQDNLVDMVIPLNDLELPIMAANREKLEASGAKIVISHPDLIDLCADKWKAYNFFKALKIHTPKSFIGIEAALLALAEKNINFPMIIKPRWGFGSIGIEEVETEEELRLAYQLVLVKIAKISMINNGGNISKNQIIIQEKIVGEEYGIDIVNDFNGNFYGSYTRKKLAMRSGETDKAISVVDSHFNDIAEKIARATRHIGIMDCDFFIRNDEVYFLEMNPRFGGGYPFSHESGINIPGIYLEWLTGNSEISRYENYQPNQMFSKCDRIVKITNPINTITKNVR